MPVHDLIGICRVSLADLDPETGPHEHELFTSIREHGSAGMIEVMSFSKSGGPNVIARQTSINRRDTLGMP